MSDRFVSEKKLDEERKTRQEEWEKVRQPDQPEEAPEPEIDHRPLYDRLKEQKDKKQMEHDEAHKLTNMVRGLDTEEVGFLDFVDKMKSAEERKRREEEKAIISDMNKTAVEVPEPSAASVGAKPRRTSGPKTNVQAQLITGAIKRKRDSEDTSGGEKKARETSEGKALEQVGLRPSALKCVAVLPGLSEYKADSDTSSDEETEEMGVTCVQPQAQTETDKIRRSSRTNSAQAVER